MSPSYLLKQNPTSPLLEVDMSHLNSDTCEEKNYPNYYAIIPANVRYCKNLEPSAKLLYGEITALSNKEGYCWANNQFFSELYEVDERTIKRWLEKLKENGFIEVNIFKQGFKTVRHIYIIQNNFMKGQNCPGRQDTGGQKCHARGEENVPHNNTINNNTPVVVVCASAREGKISKDDFHAYSIKSRKDWSYEEIEEAWIKFCDCKIEISDPYAYFEGIIEKTRKNKENKSCQTKKKPMQKEKKTQEDTEWLKKYSVKSSEKDTGEHLLANYEKEMRSKKKS